MKNTNTFRPLYGMTAASLMRTIIAGAALAMFTCSAGAAVISYYDFTNTLNDQSGNSNHLSNAGGAVISQDTAIFNGTATSYLFTTAALDLSGASDLTIEFFMKTTQTTSGYIFEQGNISAGAANGSIAGVINDGGSGNLRMWHREGGDVGREQDPGNNDGVWRHYAFLYDPEAALDTDKMRIYVDGASVQNDVSIAGVFDTFLNTNFYLGRKSIAQSLFIGELDDFRISDTLLTPAEFIQARTVIPEPSALVLLMLGGAAVVMSKKIRRKGR